MQRNIHPIEKENHLPIHHFPGSMWIFAGVICDMAHVSVVMMCFFFGGGVGEGEGHKKLISVDKVQWHMLYIFQIYPNIEYIIFAYDEIPYSK